MRTLLAIGLLLKRDGSGRWHITELMRTVHTQIQKQI